MAKRAPVLFAGSLVIVLLQCWTTVAIFTGTVFTACQTSDQCRPGQYCQVSVGREGAGRCAFCGGRPPLEVQLDLSGATLNVPDIELQCSNPLQRDEGGICLDGRDRFAGFNYSHVEEVCSAPSARVGINAIELGYRPPADCEASSSDCIPVEQR